MLSPLGELKALEQGTDRNQSGGQPFAVRTKNLTHRLNLIQPNGGQYIVKKYPSGYFTIGRSLPRKSKKNEHPLDGVSLPDDNDFGTKVKYEPRTPKEWETSEHLLLSAQMAEKLCKDDRAIALYKQSAGAKYQETINETEQWDESIGISTGDRLDDSGNKSAIALGLSVVPISHKSKAKRGSKGITPNNKRFITSALTLLEDKHGRECITFGTATLPPMLDTELALVCEKWSEITRKTFQELSRLLERRGLNPEYAYVTEIQESRYLKSGKICPHLHWVCQGKLTKKSHWLILPSEIADIWSRMLSNVLGRTVGTGTATRIENPRTSLKAEMAKYLSKGGQTIKAIVANGDGDKLPSSWVGMSASLRKEVYRNIQTLTGQEAYDFIDNLETLKQQGFLEYRKICLTHYDKVTYQPYEVLLGFVGYFKQQKSVKRKVA
jgi:hypothetical protein